MAKNRKELGNYEQKIKIYFETKSIWTKAGLLLFLGIDRKYIADCRRREKKWQKDFMQIYKVAEQRILEQRLEKALTKPELNWEYIKSAFPHEFNIENNNINNEIIINLQNDRDIENE